MKKVEQDDKRLQQVREGYTRLLHESQAVQEVRTRATSSCCGIYSPEEVAALPKEAVQSSFGCGNPLKFAEVRAGQTVLDIGSGAGIDCFLAAEKVGPSGKVIGLDMTPAMIEKARQIAAEKGYRNVEFRLGTADRMPVEGGSVDWIISNCVINLAPDKPAVFREAFRVLKPGGRLQISDIVLGKELPAEVRNDLEAYLGCLAGAIREEDYLAAMRQAGLQQVEVTSRFTYAAEDLSSWLGGISGEGSSCCGGGNNELTRLAKKYASHLAGQVWSAEIRAVKP